MGRTGALGALVALLVPGLSGAALPPQAEGAPGGAGEAARQDAAAAASGAAGAAEEEAAAPKAATPPEVAKMLEEVRRFEQNAEDYRQEIQLLIERKYKQKRDALSQSYEKAIQDVEIVERKDRLDAIALFEEFLSRYPDEARYSPDAMMRLAELYYEKTEDEFRIAEKAYYARLEELDDAAQARLGPPPVKRYEKPIALYQRIITRFPAYRYGDAAYYLLGYLLGEQEETNEALATFETLIRKYPESRFVPEVWMRIGEFFFDADQSVWPDALQRAIAAYTKALPYKDHPLYDKVLYKLGWTYYRVDDFDHSVNTFLDLLAYYEQKAKDSGEEVGGDLRGEAIQYTAISFADEKWGSLSKAISFFEARGHPPYEFEVMRRLGDVYFDLTKHTQAVDTYKYVLSRYPLRADAPEIQEKIIAAYERDRSFQKAFEEQEQLVANYSEGTAWWNAHQDDEEVLDKAKGLTEKSLRASAVFHHKQAQTFRDEDKVELAFTEYKLAADAYGKYLELYPHTKDLYDFQYYYADALYNSAQFVKAATYFARTRDSNLDSTYLEDAALGAVLAWDKEMARQEASGELETHPVLTSKDWPEGKAVTPVEIPEVRLEYVAAADQYVKWLPDSERAPAIAYKAAEVFYAYDHHEEARKRFEEIVQRWPSAEASQYAANLIIETFLIAKDWKAVEETSGRLLATKALQNAGGEVRDTFQQFKLGGRFKRAEALFAKGKYEEAADLYLALVKEAPQHEFADRAVYNAAVCYEKVLRFESALQLYERVYRDYPKSNLADQALFLVAYNAERAFDYDKAIERYLHLVDSYPESQQRQGALANAAVDLYLTQQYRKAARQFERYARLYPDDRQTSRFMLLAAECEEKQGALRGAISAYQAFIQRFRSTPSAAADVVEAHLKIAKAYESLRDRRRALSAYGETTAAFARLQDGLQGDPVALARGANFAAEAQFMIAEKAFADYDAIKIVAAGRGKRFQKNLKAVIDRKKTKAREVSDDYKKVYQYGRLEWTLAAAYRLGYVLERFAAALYEAPVPDELRRSGEEYVYAYQDQLAQVAYPIEEEAVKAYVTAEERARKEGIVNAWTKLTLESLNRYRPDQYQILKEARDGLVSEPLSPAPLAPTTEGIPPPAPVGTRLGEEGAAAAAAPAAQGGAPEGSRLGDE